MMMFIYYQSIMQMSLNRKSRRECQRKHRKHWTTKTFGDGTQIRVCHLCGAEIDDKS